MNAEQTYLGLVAWLDASDRACRYYRQALKEILGECSHDKPRIDAIREEAERGIRAADHELAALAAVAPPAEEETCPDCDGDGSLDDGRDCAWCGGTGLIFKRDEEET